MSKRVVVILFIAVGLCIGGMPKNWFPLDAFADEGFVSGSAVRTTQTVAALWGPGTDYSERFSIPEGQLLTVCRDHPTLRTNYSNGYVRIMWRGQIGWVLARYLTIERVGPTTGRSWADYQPRRYHIGICPYGTARACGYRNVW